MRGQPSIDVFSCDGRQHITPINCDCVVIRCGYMHTIRRGETGIFPDDGKTSVRIATEAEKKRAKKGKA